MGRFGRMAMKHVKYIGVGETIEDLQKFDANQFVNALFDVGEHSEEE